VENGDTGGINVIWDKINEFLQYSMDNIGYIRQEELDRFPETQNELARVRQEIEDLDNVIEQAQLQYESYRSELLESSLGKSVTIAEDEYGRGGHLLKLSECGKAHVHQ
jgi:chromosome segregation ATPase